jgi:hypothetical protein
MSWPASVGLMTLAFVAGLLVGFWLGQIARDR